MVDVHHRPRAGKEAAPSLVIRRLDAFIDSAVALSDAWDPVLEAGGYPCCLPSFDEFIHHLRAWREAANDMHAVKTSDVTPLDFADPEAVRAWLGQLHNSMDDALAAGDDATRRPSQRGLGRMTARQIVMESRHALRQLLEAADRGMKQAAPG